jgi:hypothetical protein
VEDLEDAEKLGEPDQEGDPDDRVDQVGGGALPVGRQPAADANGAEPEGEDDRRQ